MPEYRVLTGLPKALALLTVLFLAVLAAGVGASPAVAHSNHSHQAATHTSNRDVLALTQADTQLLATDQTANAGHASGPAQPDEHGKSDCCCGSIMCHAGVTLATELFPFPYPTGARLIAEPSFGRPQRNASGLERPPRITYIA